jgi:hypothetical protein
VKVAGALLVIGVVLFLTSLAYALGHDTVGSAGSGDDLMSVLGLVATIVAIYGGVVLAVRPTLSRMNHQVGEINRAVNNSPTPMSDRVDEVLVEMRLTNKMVEAVSESQANLSLEVLSISTRLDDHIVRTEGTK